TLMAVLPGLRCIGRCRAVVRSHLRCLARAWSVVGSGLLGRARGMLVFRMALVVRVGVVGEAAGTMHVAEAAATVARMPPPDKEASVAKAGAATVDPPESAESTAAAEEGVRAFASKIGRGRKHRACQ